jgi:hypothetical protein
MPCLDLTPDMIGENRTRLTLAYIESVMLWPNDEMQRKRGMEAAKRKNFLETWNSSARQGPLSTITSTVDDLGATFEWLTSAPRLEDVQEEAKRPFTHGVLAGLILGEVLAWNDINPTMSGVGQVMDSIVKRFSGEILLNFSRSSLDNIIWKKYKSVAHFWAAYIIDAEPENSIFPCKLARTTEFLALAKFFFLRGVKHRGKQSSGFLLNEADSWTVPEILLLPRIEVRWERIKRSKAS